MPTPIVYHSFTASTPFSLRSVKPTKPSLHPRRQCQISASGTRIHGRKLRAAVIGGGPAGSSAAEAMAAGGIQTYLIERAPAGAKPCGGAIPLCMLDEFSVPLDLIDRRVRRMKIISPSNRVVDFGRTLKSHEYIPMLRREVLDSFLRSRAESRGAQIITGLFLGLQLPVSSSDPYVITYTSSSEKTFKTLQVDVVIGADGANSRVAKAIDAGDYTCAIAFQERIRLPEDKMKHYNDLAEMYVGGDVSPDFYAWVFPKCDHVAVGTGTVISKSKIKQFQRSIRSRAGDKIAGGKVVKIEAHPIPEHPRPRRIRDRVALVGDAAGYVTKCSGEGIYFAAKSGRMCGEAVVSASERGERMVTELDLKERYLKKWDSEFSGTFRWLDLVQKVFYGSDQGREALVEMCSDEYVQRMTFQSYLYKKLAKGDPLADIKMGWRTLGSLIRANVVGKEMAKINE